MYSISNKIFKLNLFLSFLLVLRICFMYELIFLNIGDGAYISKPQNQNQNQNNNNNNNNWK